MATKRASSAKRSPDPQYRRQLRSDGPVLELDSGIKMEPTPEVKGNKTVMATKKASSAKRPSTGNGRTRDNNWRDTRTSAQCLSYLCLSEHLSDISLTFSSDESVKLPAHKFVLSMRSAVFEAMFFGSLSEGGETVLIKDVEPEVMKVVLQYIYTDKPNINGSNVLACLYTAKKYDLAGLVQQCSDYLENNIDKSNVCSIHEQAVLYEMKPLQEKCLALITENATDVLSSSGFFKLSQATLLSILKRDDLEGEEIEIFQAAVRWAEHHCQESNKSGQNVRNQLGEALFQIRFPIMPIDVFARDVTPSGILTNEELVMLYQYNATKGSTHIGKFRTQERTSVSVTVDLGRYESGRNFKKGNTLGCFLKLGYMYNKYPTKVPIETPRVQEPRTKLISIKSVRGYFVKKVVGIWTCHRNSVINYEVQGNKIIFKNPINVTDDLEIEFTFRNNGSSRKSQEYPATYSCNINHVKNIKGQMINIETIPDGLETITFV